MTDQQRTSPSAGGIFLAILPLVGAFGGGYVFGEPVIGFLAGLALGTVIAIGLWLRERKG